MLQAITLGFYSLILLHGFPNCLCCVPVTIRSSAVYGKLWVECYRSHRYFWGVYGRSSDLRAEALRGVRLCLPNPRLSGKSIMRLSALQRVKVAVAQAEQTCISEIIIRPLFYTFLSIQENVCITCQEWLQQWDKLWGQVNACKASQVAYW